MKTNAYSSKSDLPESVAALLTLQQNLASVLSQKKHVCQSADSEAGALRRQNDRLRRQLYRINILLDGLNLECMPEDFTPLQE